jgi:mannosyl-3-phosphoglycerate phosphatase
MPMDHQLNGDHVSAPDIRNLIVFSDLDGTLLDHGNYSHSAAAPALARLRHLAVPLILASSKTAAEIVPLRDELGFSDCEAIVENGSGILEGGVESDAIETSYQAIRQALERLPTNLRAQYEGFGDWSAKQVSDLTGLSIADAANARKRQFSEPGLWLGNEADKAMFLETVNAMGLIAQQGGRFLTLSFGGNKAERMMEIAARHSRQGMMPFMVALGDAGNDLAMIEQADLGVIIPNPAHSGIPPCEGEATGRIIRADAAGPEGWNQVIMSLLDRAENHRS